MQAGTMIGSSEQSAHERSLFLARATEFGRLASFALLLGQCVALCDERAELLRLQLVATTEAYRDAALEVLLQDVNQMAGELELPERLPIRPSELLETRINTPFWADSAGAFGSVRTSNYYYFASVGNRLSWVDPDFGPDEIRRPAYMEALRKQYLLPKAQMDKNAAYGMATQWLAKAGMDVQGLERDAQQVDISAWEIGAKFVPLYLVRWRRLAVYRGDDSPPQFASLASIQFLMPERRVLQMRVNQPKYIKRKPLIVPERDRLLQQTDDPKLRELWLTTESYKAAALEVMLKEVNWIARALRLPEEFSIDAAALTEVVIGTPYTAAHHGCFATVQTKKYSYWASQKLTAINRLYPYGEEEFLASIRTRYTMPSSQMNGNSAYALATQWLASGKLPLN
jgi:hypothetical protein